MSAEVEFFLWLGIYLFGIIITYIGVYVFDDSASREDSTIIAIFWILFLTYLPIAFIAKMVHKLAERVRKEVRELKAVHKELEEARRNLQEMELEETDVRKALAWWKELDLDTREELVRAYFPGHFFHHIQGSTIRIQQIWEKERQRMQLNVTKPVEKHYPTLEN